MADGPAPAPCAPNVGSRGPDWAAYYTSTIGREPRPQFVKGVAAAGRLPTG
jgi:hypothetical protein